MDVANWSGVRATALREHQPFYTVLPDRTDLRQNGNGKSGVERGVYTLMCALCMLCTTVAVYKQKTRRVV